MVRGRPRHRPGPGLPDDTSSSSPMSRSFTQICCCRVCSTRNDRSILGKVDRPVRRLAGQGAPAAGTALCKAARSQGKPSSSTKAWVACADHPTERHRRCPQYNPHALSHTLEIKGASERGDRVGAAPAPVRRSRRSSSTPRSMPADPAQVPPGRNQGVALTASSPSSAAPQTPRSTRPTAALLTSIRGTPTLETGTLEIMPMLAPLVPLRVEHSSRIVRGQADRLRRHRGGASIRS